MPDGLSFIKPLRQLIVFCGVGFLNTVFCLTLIFIFSVVYHFHYIAANIISYASAMVMSFILHRRFTFRSQGPDKILHQQILFFLIVSGVAYLCQFGILIFMVEVMHIPDMAAQIISIIFYVLISFAGNKFVTFPEGPKSS